MNNKDRKIQDLYLNSLRKEKVPVVIFLVNGTRLKGVITGFDNFVILLKQSNQQLVYKHAVSTISPDREFNFKLDSGQDN